MALKIITALKKQVSIKDMIHTRLAGWEKPRSHKVLHASDLMKDLEFCPREHAFLSMGLAKKRDSFIGTALRVTFDHGRDMENRVRNDWLRDVMVGDWECVVCGAIHPQFGKVPKVKCSCGYTKWTYVEPRFTSTHSAISGGIDGLVDVGGTKSWILEIKSMDKDMFKDLKAPLAEHRFRTSLYMKLAAESDLPHSDRVNIHEASILYVSKSFGFKDETMKAKGISDSPFSPFKEYIVQRDDNLVATPVNKAYAYTYWRLHSDELGLPCGVCANGLQARAQKCTAVSQCFSGSFPHRYTWRENGEQRHSGKELVE